MKPILLVALGGGLGSVLRYLVSRCYIDSWQRFPWQTLLINLLGSLLIGVILGFIHRKGASNDWFQYFWLMGICGGFTTFSSFSKECMQLLQHGAYFSVLLYISLSITVGIGLTFLGYSIMK